MAIRKAYCYEDPISTQRYEDEWEEASLEPAQMAAGENYVLRLITTLANPDHFADDFLVHISSMDFYRGTPLLLPRYKVKVHPVTADLEVLDEFETKYVRELGSVSRGIPPRIDLFNTAYEEGYFVSKIDEWDVALCGLHAVTLNLVPSTPRPSLLPA